MAICANQGRMYMGTARQYMENPCSCQQTKMEKCTQIPKPTGSCECEHLKRFKSDTEQTVRCHEDGCQPESLCFDLPLAMAYMNPQPYTGLVSGDVALMRGSAFNNLYDPWMPGMHC